MSTHVTGRLIAEDITPTRANARVALVAMVSCGVAAWLLLHPYGGLIHDSTIYTLLALARLHPDALSSDLFLRFGSQDQFTLFSPIYARAIALFGMEPAAQLITFSSHLAFFWCAWTVARRFMPPLTATLSTTLLIVMPGEYGSGIYFHFAEPFVTPRLLAEALVLAGIAATLTKRYWIAATCLIVAMSLHPIMAAAGVAFIVLTFIAPIKPKLFVGMSVALMTASLLMLAVAPVTRLDAQWLRVVRVTSPFLYVTTWSISDWIRVEALVAVLTIGLLTSTTSLVRKICAGALVLLGCGLLITTLYCDILHVAIFTALQAWRWLWLAMVLGILLLPLITRDCWHRGSLGRTAVALLVAGWVLHGDGLVLYLLPFSVACAAVPQRWRDHRYARLAFFAACGILVLAIGLDLSDRLPYLPTDVTTDPPLIQKVRVACADGVVPGILVMLLWFGLQASKGVSPRCLLLAAFPVLACLLLLPLGWSSWTQSHYTPTLYDKFAGWRAAVPQHAEVMWPDTPVGAWYLLERPSYWSAPQIAGAIFSRDKAILLAHRTQALNTILRDSGMVKRKPDDPDTDLTASGDTSKMNAAALRLACADHDLQYVASWLHLGQTPAAAPVQVDPSKPSSLLRLYRCADFRT